MKAIKIIRNIFIVVTLLFLALDFLLILPEYCACKNASENAKAITIWGYHADCFGDNQEFTLAFFQIIGLWIIGLLIFTILLHIIYRKQKSALKDKN
ncbi:hypothetical protein BAX95_08535 [Elizabethkingia meningoseptica]|uniref:hypothetical protein n=1 Tax=Elizabethkingia meningoseptica TaxID=238 RepID=UPI0009994E8B|nr:hypothetical protein [Elizabethkingia meningoseptica]OPC20424.1 hypothetical protein BAX95_08535 [Elizabethkingia meningoseptica]